MATRVSAVIGVLVLALVLLGGAVLKWSGVSLRPDAVALARVRTEAFGGTLVAAQASVGGKAVPLTERDGVLTPRRKVDPGATIEVDATVRRPGWIAWAIGSRHVERLEIRAPVAHVTRRWLTAEGSGAVPVAFDAPVARSAATIAGDAARTTSTGASSVALATRSAAGSARVRVAPRSWEHLGTPTEVTWFPRSAKPVALVSPAPGGAIAPAQAVRMTFSRPVSEVLGAKRPSLGMAGRWRTVDSHTVAFAPTGFGAGLDTTVAMRLPREVAVTDATGAGLKTTRSVSWRTPAGSMERLQQLLAEERYLPLAFEPSGKAVAHTKAAEYAAAVDAPAGAWHWKYADTPSELKDEWSAGQANEVTRAAIMKFQDEHHLTVDAIAGGEVWKELIADAVAGRRHHGAYSYVYVHRDASPSTLTLWSAGRTVLTSPGNPGVPGAPTALGSYPVFEHLRETTMSGENPDGSHYTDPGIKWVSYFNGGDALHAFNRASFGTPQSVGCIELPEAKAAKVWPYTPIGTLVTIEK